jgi:hypothetical protein
LCFGEPIEGSLETSRALVRPRLGLDQRVDSGLSALLRLDQLLYGGVNMIEAFLDPLPGSVLKLAGMLLHERLKRLRQRGRAILTELLVE